MQNFPTVARKVKTGWNNYWPLTALRIINAIINRNFKQRPRLFIRLRTRWYPLLHPPATFVELVPLHHLIDLDLQSPEHRTVASRPQAFETLNPGFVEVPAE